jgi:hypothetical protein
MSFGWEFGKFHTQRWRSRCPLGLLNVFNIRFTQIAGKLRGLSKMIFVREFEDEFV